MNFAWERLCDGVHRCRLPFLDVTVGLVHGRAGTLLIDTGSTLSEAGAIEADVEEITCSAVSHIVWRAPSRRCGRPSTRCVRPRSIAAAEQ